MPASLHAAAIHALELAAMRAWPALERIDEDGWTIRFAGGYTRRANSATSLAARDDDLEARVGWAERQFAARGLPPIFRVLSSGGPPRLDPILEAAGYHRADESLVMTLELANAAGLGAAAALAPLPLDAWLDLFDRLSGKGGVHRTLHRRLLEAIADERLLAGLDDAGGCHVGCGLAVRDGPLAGLFDLVVDPQRRGHGHGRRLVDGLLGWASDRGARRAYLQVLATNEVAVRLYERAGFREAYRYWYRLPARRP